jgi:hypothetical protein
MNHPPGLERPENDHILGDATRTHGSNPARSSQRSGIRFPRRDPPPLRFGAALLCVVSRRRVGRDVGFAKSGFRPTESWVSRPIALSPTRRIAATAFSPHPAPVYGGRSRTYCYRRRESMDQEELLRPQEISSRSYRLVADADSRVRPVKCLSRRHD